MNKLLVGRYNIQKGLKVIFFPHFFLMLPKSKFIISVLRLVTNPVLRNPYLPD